MADLIDIKIENGKFVFDATGDIVFVRGADRIRQQVEFRLSLWAGEWFLDETFGTPYLLRILGKSAVSIDAAVDALREQIMSVDGVLSINRLDYDFDNTARKLTIDVDIQSEYGVVTYQSAAQLDAAPQYEDRTAIDMRATELDPRIIVNSNPAHGIRGAGGFLVMTADGDYPAEMVNNVQVGRQLPMTRLDGLTFTSMTQTFYTALNENITESPGGGLAAMLVGTAAGATYDPYVERNYDFSRLKAGDRVRMEALVKRYDQRVTKCTLGAVVADPTLREIGSVIIDPVTGTITTRGAVDHVRAIPYGGGWLRIVASFTYPGNATAFKMRYGINRTNSAVPTVDFQDAVLFTLGDMSLAGETISSLRPDGVVQSPAASISVAKMYGASAVRVLLSNGQYYDLPFGNADHVNLPTNPYDVGDAYITRIEYRG